MESAYILDTYPHFEQNSDAKVEVPELCSQENRPLQDLA